MASAATEFSFTKYSFDRSSATQFSVAKTSAMENVKTGFEKSVFDTPVTIQKPDFPGVSVNPTMPEITRPSFNPLPAPTIRVPNLTFPRTDSTSGNLPSPRGILSITITQEEAIEIALALWPGIDLHSPIKATLKFINAPAYPLATNPCWVVELEGVHSDCSAYHKVPGYGIDKTIPMVPCILYGGQVIIDAITGEVLYKDTLA